MSRVAGDSAERRQAPSAALSLPNPSSTTGAGREPRLPAAGVAEHTARNWESGDAGIGTAEPREWQALLRRLDRIDSSYRN